MLPVPVNVSMQVKLDLRLSAQPVLHLLQIEQFVLGFWFVAVWKGNRIVVDEDTPNARRQILQVSLGRLQRLLTHPACGAVPRRWVGAVPSNQMPVIVQAAGVNFLFAKKRAEKLAKAVAFPRLSHIVVMVSRHNANPLRAVQQWSQGLSCQGKLFGEGKLGQISADHQMIPLKFLGCDHQLMISPRGISLSASQEPIGGSEQAFGAPLKPLPGPRAEM